MISVWPTERWYSAATDRFRLILHGWINCHPWPQWRIEVVAAVTPSLDRVSTEGSELHEWQPANPHRALSDSRIDEVIRRTCELDPRLALSRSADLLVIGHAVEEAVEAASAPLTAVGADVRHEILCGVATVELLRHLEQNNPDLVVLGTRGLTGESKQRLANDLGHLVHMPFRAFPRSHDQGGSGRHADVDHIDIRVMVANCISSEVREE